ncbi:ribose 5-phosphate isomerase B [Acidobacteria bacterium AH-259-D05]|nr:ribose 5-phosphate isomerase B [Acidobacteria bacterium AH-259-D05]
MRIAIGADHAGFPLKDWLIETLREEHTLLDLGTDSTDPVDYPDYARAVGEAVINGKAEVGILLCGSGVGASIAANKISGIRAALCHDAFSARQSREDDDANILCLGPRVIGPKLAEVLVRIFIETKFSGVERHRRRLEKILELERERADL